MFEINLWIYKCGLYLQAIYFAISNGNHPEYPNT